MYPIPPSETLVQTKTCRHCSTSFPITDKDLEFYEKVSPVFNGKRYSIPAPTLCPDCRQQRRLSFRNERKLYKRNCDATGKSIISIYSPDKPFKVYHQDYWWSDKWDPMEYGRNFDFGRGFFEQFEEMKLQVPYVSIANQNGINSDYCNAAISCKDSYLCFTANDIEDCLYSGNLSVAQDVVDCYRVARCENCYGCVNVISSINCYYSNDLSECSNCRYCYECKWCKDCIFCVGETNASYKILNKSYSKEEYTEVIKNILGDEKFFKRNYLEFQKLLKSIPKKSSEIVNSQHCTGDYISNSSGCKICFDVNTSQNIAYSSFSKKDNSDCYDIDAFMNSHLGYEVLSYVDSYKQTSSLFSWYSNDIFYCDNCRNSSHLFWCIGLRNKQYCILNKQYTREEYETLVPRIIEHMQKTGEWGEFFPSSLSPFGYNETVAMEYYPLTRDQISEGSNQNGKNIFNWSDYEAPFPRVEKIIPADKLPDDISKIPDDILNWAIECEVTKKPFRIIQQELEFYRKHHLPIPRRHPDQRHLDRMALRNPRKLFERKCDKCGVGMVTTYAPERPEKVYCWACYDMEVLW